ncbi:MAG: hypothetical protein MZV63_46890 [Marinilabiliales bacterium]|nr:hypothetical protein [Marinilabiliales bacterium]
MNNIFFQYYSLIIFLVVVAVMFIVSYATEQPVLRKDQRADLRDGHLRTQEGEPGELERGGCHFFRASSWP